MPIDYEHINAQLENLILRETELKAHQDFINQKLRELETHRSTVQRIFTIIISFLALTLGIASAITVLSISDTKFTKTTNISTQQTLLENIKKLKTTLNTLHTSSELHTLQISDLSALDPSFDTSKQITLLQTEIKRLNQRTTTLERGILDSPEKALSLPLLRRDFENLTTNHQKDFQTTNHSIDRVYDQNRWFIGIMAPIAVTLIGLGINTYIQRPKKTQQPQNLNDSEN